MSPELKKTIKTPGTKLTQLRKKHYSYINNLVQLNLKDIFEKNLNTVKSKFKNLDKHIIPSLVERAKRDDWLLNPIIRRIIQKHIAYLGILESFLDKAKPDSIKNFNDIFAEIKGESEKYDERLEDAMAEVSACSFLRFQKHNEIERLTGEGKPDFISRDKYGIYLTEAKHLREPDEFLYMIFHVFNAAAIYDKELQRYDFSLCPTKKYIEEKEKNKESKDNRLKFKRQCKTIIKNNLIKDLKRLLKENNFDRGQKICDDFLAISYINKGSGGIFFRPRPIENGAYVLGEELGYFRNKLDRTVEYAVEEQLLKYEQKRTFKNYYVFISWTQPGEFMFIKEEIKDEFFEQIGGEYYKKYNNKVFLARKAGRTFKIYPNN